MEIHGYSNHYKTPSVAELPNVQNLDFYVLKGKSGIEVEIHGKNESVSLTVGEKSYDLVSRDGELFVDGFCVSSLIDKEINQEWAMVKEGRNVNTQAASEYFSKISNESEAKIRLIKESKESMEELKAHERLHGILGNEWVGVKTIISERADSK